jgi:CHASE2 domain-containing sensor protein
MSPRATTAARRLLVPLAAALAGIAVAFGASGLGLLERWENDSVDARFSLRDVPTPEGIVVVEIDEASLGQLPTFPFSRKYHARAVDELRKARAGLIVYDVQFSEESPDPEADFALFDAIGEAGGAVLAASTSKASGDTDVFGGDGNLANVGAVAGAANLPAEEAGMIRRYERLTGRLPALAVMAAHRVKPGSAVRANFPDGRAWIDFRGGPGTFPTVSFIDLVEGRVPPASLRGKIVVIGASAPTLQDVHPTPTSGSRQMSGPEIQANAIWTALNGNPLRDGPGWIGSLAIVLLALLAPLAMATRRFLLTVVVAGVLVAAQAIITMALFNHGLVVPFVAPLLGLAVATFAALVSGALLEAAERRRVARANQRLREELGDAHMEVVRRLAIAAESHDDQTGGHIERISELTYRLAKEIGLPEDEAELIRHASLMHDVGKIATPDAVLRKPGKLDDAEWEVMRRHTIEGARILTGSSSRLVQLAETITMTHHEKYDGSGYPNGLRGEEIPLAGRVTAVCDVFDALVSKRHYKSAWGFEDTLAEIVAQRGRHFDPDLVDAFMRIAAELPASLVGAGELPEDILRTTAEAQAAPGWVADVAPSAATTEIDAKPSIVPKP